MPFCLRSSVHAPAATLAAGLLLVACAATAAPRTPSSHFADAPDGIDQPLSAFSSDELVPERKRPSIWHRPAAATPAEQLARGAALEAAGRLRSAVAAYTALVHQWHESPEALAAQRGVARLQEQRRKYVKAFEAHQYLLAYYADRFPSAESLESQFAIANLCRERGSSDRSREMFDIVARTAPNWPKSRAARLQVGLLQEADGDFAEAAATFELLLTSHPGSPEAMDASFHAALCRYRLARRYARDGSANSAALSALAMLLRDFPDHPRRPEAERMLAEMKEARAEQAFMAAAFYDGPRHKPATAVAAYREFLRRFPEAARAAEARRRIEQLESASRPPEESAAP